MISFDEKNATFTLTGKGMIYAMGVSDGVLEHRYFGAPIHAGDDLSLFRGEAAGSFEARMPGTVSQNQISAEAPAYGRGDYREPMLVFRGEEGETTVDLRYAGYRVFRDHKLAGLPTSFGGETLGVTLSDPVRGVSVELFYTVFDDAPVVARSARIKNAGKGKLKILRAFSAARARSSAFSSGSMNDLNSTSGFLISESVTFSPFSCRYLRKMRAWSRSSAAWISK